MRIVIFSDSLGMPRLHLSGRERTEYTDIYGYHLRQKLTGACEVELLYFISLDSEEAALMAQYQLAFRQPDLVIFHLGINDCAPRVFRKGNHNIIFRPWFPRPLQRLALGFVRRSRRFLTRYLFRGRVYVKPEHFRRNWHNVIKTVQAFNPDCRFWALSIAPTLPGIDKRSYSFDANVAHYNSILREVFREDCIDLNHVLGGNPETYLISDGIHLTRDAHTALAEYLHNRITSTLELSGEDKPR